MVAEPELVAVKLGTFPLPLAAKPMLVLLLVHVKVVPEGAATKFVAATVLPVHTEIPKGTVTIGVGLTVIV